MSNMADVSPRARGDRGLATSVAARTAELAAEPSSVHHLAKFFPAGIPVRLPVRVTAPGGEAEQTVIEYGTPQEVLFLSELPLEFGERIRVRNVDGSLDADALVVALQFRSGKTAVAARFASEVANWIVKP